MSITRTLGIKEKFQSCLLNENFEEIKIETNRKHVNFALLKLNANRFDNNKLINLSILDFLYDGPFKDNIDKIAMAFTEVFNDMNLTSMILVHYPVSPKAVKSTYYSVIDRKLNLIYKYIDIRSVTVLTGDATGFKNYKGFLSSVKGKKVLCLQVPHHGSYKNWRTLNGKLGLQLDNGIRYILPFGIGNSYGHPNVEVLKDLDKYHCDYYFVTQYSAFEYEIEIYIPKELALDNSLCCGYMI